MESNNSSSLKGFLLGAAIGGAVGAVTALLMAPKSGRELRDDIASRGEDMYNKAQGYLQKGEKAIEEAAEDFMNEGRTRAERIVNTARAQADHLMSNAEQVLRDAKSRAQSVKESVQHGAQKVSDAAKAGADAFRSELS